MLDRYFNQRRLSPSPTGKLYFVHIMCLISQCTDTSRYMSTFIIINCETRIFRAAEKAMRDIITANFPEHGIYGEEFGIHNPDADLVWVLDPIDGTKSFITGKVSSASIP